MKMRKVVQYLRQKFHGMVGKYWASNQKIWVLDLALGAYYLYDPEELSIFTHSFKSIAYLLSESTMMNP